MEKKTISVHAFTVHIYTITIALLLLLVIVLGLKYAHLKWSVNGYTASTIWMNEQGRPSGQVSDYAVIIGQSLNQVPEADQQNYISSLSKTLNRDIVVLDSTKKIIADTLSSNKGATYTYDENGEIGATLQDGNTRIFQEKSVDYPNGIAEVVVTTRNIKGDITGAVLISNSLLK